MFLTRTFYKQQNTSRICFVSRHLLYLCGPVCVLQCHLLSGSPGQGGNRDLVSLSAGLVLKNTALIKEAPALILHT